ncbi:carbon storage regulator CsrA [Paenibacillus sp. D51F]
MLVLSRRKGEAIIIQDHIEIIVVGVEGDTVKLGISAPREVDVYRKEVYEAIKQSNLEASLMPSMDAVGLLAARLKK